MTYGVPGTARSHIPFVIPGRPDVGTVSRRPVTSATRNTKLCAAAGLNFVLIAYINSRALRVSAFQRNLIATTPTPRGRPYGQSTQTLPERRQLTPTNPVCRTPA